MGAIDRFIWKWLASHPWGFGAMAGSFTITFTTTSVLLGSPKGIEKYFAISGAAFALAGVLTAARLLARQGYRKTFAKADRNVGGRPFKLSETDHALINEADDDHYAELFAGPVLVGVGAVLGGIDGFIG